MAGTFDDIIRSVLGGDQPPMQDQVVNQKPTIYGSMTQPIPTAVQSGQPYYIPSPPVGSGAMFDSAPNPGNGPKGEDQSGMQGSALGDLLRSLGLIAPYNKRWKA